MRALLALAALALVAAAPLPAPEMVTIPAADFTMGSDTPETIMIGRPAHQVHPKAFAIARYAVTFDDYDAFTAATKRRRASDHGWGRGSRPVIDVTFADTMAYIAWLNARTGRHFRLPSEAEWEYAAGAGVATPYYWGGDLDPAKLNVGLDKGPDTYKFTAPVGSFPPNSFGLYDMAGNVFQRVADCRRATYDGAPADGSAADGKPCDDRVIRGGSWYSLGRVARFRARGAAPENFRSSALGFRLAEDVP